MQIGSIQKNMSSQDKSQNFDGLKQTGKVKDFNAQFDLGVANLPAGQFSEQAKVDSYVQRLKYPVRNEVKYRYPDDIVEAQNIALAFEKPVYQPRRSNKNNGGKN